MKFSWVPVLVVRQNMCQLLYLGLLGATVLSIGGVAESLHASRHQFPKQDSIVQKPKGNRNQFPIQRRGSGTHWHINTTTLNT